jgi:GNAT superfamily N-acetyltransferase
VPEITVRLPPLDELARRWAELEPLLKRATDRTDCYEPIDLLRFAMGGRMGIWFIERDGQLLAGAVTELRQFPRKRVLEVPFIGGRGLALWHRQLLEALDAHARDNGCAVLMGYDRKGWSNFGFKISGVLMERHLA